MVKKIDKKIVAYKVRTKDEPQEISLHRMTWCICTKPCCARSG